jgi:hypothetical protein
MIEMGMTTMTVNVRQRSENFSHPHCLNTREAEPAELCIGHEISSRSLSQMLVFSRTVMIHIFVIGSVLL